MKKIFCDRCGLIAEGVCAPWFSLSDLGLEKKGKTNVHLDLTNGNPQYPLHKDFCQHCLTDFCRLLMEQSQALEEKNRATTKNRPSRDERPENNLEVVPEI